MKFKDLKKGEIDGVSGGFNKWSIRINDDLESIVVGAYHYPIQCEIILADLFPKDARELGEMFISWARKKEEEIIEKK